jgi:hypothetical protein
MFDILESDTKNTETNELPTINKIYPLFPTVAGHGNIMYAESGKLYKLMDKSYNEYDIYKLGRLNYPLFFESFVPKLFGRVCNMLKLEDLTFKYTKPHVIDIKVGSRKANKVHTCKYFSIKGYTDSELFTFNPKRIFSSDDEIHTQFNNFLSKCSNKVPVISKWVSKLKTMSHQLKNINLKLAGISLVLIYDESDKEDGSVHMVDFSRVSPSETYDSEVAFAIDKLIILFEEL